MKHETSNNIKPINERIKLNHQNTDYLNQMADEIVVNIISFLSDLDLASFYFGSKRFKLLLEEFPDIFREAAPDFYSIIQSAKTFTNEKARKAAQKIQFEEWIEKELPRLREKFPKLETEVKMIKSSLDFDYTIIQQKELIQFKEQIEYFILPFNLKNLSVPKNRSFAFLLLFFGLMAIINILFLSLTLHYSKVKKNEWHELQNNDSFYEEDENCGGGVSSEECDKHLAAYRVAAEAVNALATLWPSLDVMLPPMAFLVFIGNKLDIRQPALSKEQQVEWKAFKPEFDENSKKRILIEDVVCEIKQRIESILQSNDLIQRCDQLLNKIEAAGKNSVHALYELTQLQFGSQVAELREEFKLRNKPAELKVQIEEIVEEGVVDLASVPLLGKGSA